jgi:hypothetical protein
MKNSLIITKQKSYFSIFLYSGVAAEISVAGGEGGMRHILTTALQEICKQFSLSLQEWREV